MSLYAVIYTDEGVTRYDDVEVAASMEGPTWVHATGGDSDAIETLRDTFGIHPLAVEDIVENRTRPKAEEFDDYTFVLMKSARLSQREDVAFAKEVQTTPVGFFIGDDWLVTLSTRELPRVQRVQERLSAGEERLLRRGPDFVAYRVMDAIVDGYYDLLDEIEGDIEAIEDTILSELDPEVLEVINDVRRDLLAFRKIAWPAREAIAYLARGDAETVTDRNEKYFRDIYDHLVQAVDLTETYRDLTTGSRDIYLNQVSQSTNEVMKVLTVVATIFIPLTFVVGIYGMNFDPAASPYNMPELLWPYGYPATMLGMLAIVLIMLSYFRRQHWI